MAVPERGGVEAGEIRAERRPVEGVRRFDLILRGLVGEKVLPGLRQGLLERQGRSRPGQGGRQA
jgi:hypothetical protein